MLFLVPESVTELGRGQAPGISATPTGEALRFLNRRVVCAAVGAAAGGFTIYGYLGLYPTYLLEAHGFSPVQAGWAASMFGIGALGALVGGAVADRVDQRLLNVAGFLGIMILGVAIFGFAAPLIGQMMLSVYTNTSTLMQCSVDVEYLGRVSGLFVAAMYIPAAASGYFFAHMRDGFGWHTAGIVQLTVIPLIGLAAMAAMGSVTTQKGMS